VIKLHINQSSTQSWVSLTGKLLRINEQYQLLWPFMYMSKVGHYHGDLGEDEVVGGTVPVKKLGLV